MLSHVQPIMNTEFTSMEFSLFELHYIFLYSSFKRDYKRDYKIENELYLFNTLFEFLCSDTRWINYTSFPQYALTVEALLFSYIRENSINIQLKLIKFSHYLGFPHPCLAKTNTNNGCMYKAIGHYCRYHNNHKKKIKELVYSKSLDIPLPIAQIITDYYM